MNFVPAICPQCAGSIQVPQDRDIVKCMYCGIDVVVRQAIRLVHGNNTNLLQLADAAREAGNHSEAINYYNKVLENDTTSVRAWIGKGTSAGWSSTLGDFRFQEMLVAFENSAKYADPTEKPGVLKEASHAINQVAIACYQISRNHAIEFIALENTWSEYLPRCEIILSALKLAHEYDPEDITIIENIIHLCKDNIDGVAYNDPYDNNLRKTVFLSDAYEAQLRSVMQVFADKLKAVNPSYEPPEAKRPSSGCFVVTATFSDENHPHVRLLRAYRDEVLQRSTIGKIICQNYYNHGPKLAKIISKSSVLRFISRKIFVAPAVLFARKLLISRESARQNQGRI